MPDLFNNWIASNCFKISLVLVEAGNAKSTTLYPSESLFLVLLLLISASEQIQIGLIGSLASASHSRKVWPNKAIEGTRNKTKPLPSVSFSAIRKDVNVLPVPQAIMSLPRSWVLKWSCVWYKAFCWCGKRDFCAAREAAPCPPFSNCSQFTGACSRLLKLIRKNGGFWLRIASSALTLHALEVVEIQRRFVKATVSKLWLMNFLLEVAIKVSILGLSM